MSWKMKRSTLGSRAAQRGAALLEGIAVAAACMGLLMLGLAVYGREGALLARDREVRLSAWQRALAGCAGSERVGELASAMLAGRAADVEQLVGRVRVLADAQPPVLVPCNEPATNDEGAWSRAEADLEQHVLPSFR